MDLERALDLLDELTSAEKGEEDWEEADEFLNTFYMDEDNEVENDVQEAIGQMGAALETLSRILQQR